MAASSGGGCLSGRGCSRDSRRLARHGHQRRTGDLSWDIGPAFFLVALRPIIIYEPMVEGEKLTKSETPVQIRARRRFFSCDHRSDFPATGHRRNDAAPARWLGDP